MGSNPTCKHTKPPNMKAMGQGRPAIPVALQRRVKEEAGHRCAIPTCKATSALELAHIDPWAKVQEHTFDNLIYLCAICHTRYDRNEIDKQSMRQYKANLSVINSRYNSIERRILEALHKGGGHTPVELNGVAIIHFLYLVEDKLIREVPSRGGVFISGVAVRRLWELTDAGRVFAARWFSGQPL